MSTLLVQVYDCAQELAPGIEEEVLQRIAKVTAHLQADLVAVTGVKVAVQAPVELVVEDQKTFDSLHKPFQIQTVPSISTDRVAESSETVVLENVEIVDNIVTTIEHASAEQLVDEKIAAEYLISNIQETTEVLTKGQDSLQAAEAIHVENSALPVTEQIKFNEDQIIGTDVVTKTSGSLTAASAEEELVESIAFEQPVKREIEESINKNGKFRFFFFFIPCCVILRKPIYEYT